MNETIKKLLLEGDKFMLEMHLRQPKFTYCSCENKERIKKFKEIGDSKYTYQNELDKAWFQHSMAYGFLKIYLEEELLIEYCAIKHLLLLKN